MSLLTRLSTPLAVSMLAIPIHGTSNFHITPRALISTFPSVDDVDAEFPLEMLLCDRDVEKAYGPGAIKVSQRYSLRHEVGNASSRSAFKLPQCMWMRRLEDASDHLDKAFDQRLRRRGFFFKIGVVALCLFLVGGIILMELMSGDSSDSRSHIDLTTNRVRDLRDFPTNVSRRTLMHSDRSAVPKRGDNPPAIQAPICLQTRSLFDSCSSVARSYNGLADCDGPPVGPLKEPPRTQSARCPTQPGGISPSQGDNFQAKPLMICPELISTVESHFTIGLKSLDSASGPVQIYGSGQKCLFNAQIHKTDCGTREVVLTMGNDHGALLGSIISAGGRRMTVRDRHQRPYATFTSVGHLAYSLTYCGVEAMKLRTDSRTGRVLVVNSYGENVASAAKLHDLRGLPSPEDHLGISMAEGMDPILIILVFIGAMALPT